MATCNDCGAEMAWLMGTDGKWKPMEPGTFDKAQDKVYDPSKGHVLHHTVCPAKQDNRPESLILFDFETTGLDPFLHDPIQVAAVALQPGSLEEIGRFSATMRPMRPQNATAKALEVHGITLEALRDAEHPIEAAVRFREWHGQYKSPVPVGYRLEFDEKFMALWCPDLEWNRRRCDLLHLVRGLFVLTGKIEDGKLETVTKYLGIPHQAHDALGDVLATAEVLRRVTRYMNVLEAQVA